MIEVAHHYDTFERQAHAGRFGMWVFLSSEILLFGGLFTVYTAGRIMWPEAFTEGVHHNLRWLGSLNTVILIISSYTVASAVHAAELGRRRATTWLLIGTIVLGLSFLGLKLYEYAQHLGEGAVPQGGTQFYVENATPGLPYFFALYFVMTGTHALHVIVGLTVVGWMIFAVQRGQFTERSAHHVEIGGLYWHLIDIIWIFLWPLFYLTGGGHT